MSKAEFRSRQAEKQTENLLPMSRGRAIAVTLAAVWLQAIVIIYVVLQIERVATPFNEWFQKILNLFGR